MQSLNISDRLINGSFLVNYVIFDNSSLNEHTDFVPEYHRTIRICLLITMIFFSLVGNGMVCRQLLPLRRRRFPETKVLFLNLAAADLLVTFAAVTSQAIWESVGKDWVAGDAFCKIFKFLQAYSLTLSTYMLVSIALDHHNAIVMPFVNTTEPKAIAVLSWIWSFLISFQCLGVFHEVVVSENQSYCASFFYTSQYPQYGRQLYMTFVILFDFIIPFVMIGILCTGILNAIWTQSSVFFHNELSLPPLFRARTKTLKMILVIFLVFVITNLPYVILEMIVIFLDDVSVLNRNAVAFFGVISMANNCINPYIYLYFQSRRKNYGKWRKGIIISVQCRKTGALLSRKCLMRNTSIEFSQTSSRVDINAHSTCLPSQTFRAPYVDDVLGKIEETFF